MACLKSFFMFQYSHERCWRISKKTTKGGFQGKTTTMEVKIYLRFKWLRLIAWSVGSVLALKLSWSCRMGRVSLVVRVLGILLPYFHSKFQRLLYFYALVFNSFYSREKCTRLFFSTSQAIFYPTYIPLKHQHVDGTRFLAKIFLFLFDSQTRKTCCLKK
jgi:hypothetical protein